MSALVARHRRYARIAASSRTSIHACLPHLFTKLGEKCGLMIQPPPENPKIENEFEVNNSFRSTDYNQISSVQKPAILVMCYAVLAIIPDICFSIKQPLNPEARRVQGQVF
jgi:hypothetical protein